MTMTEPGQARAVTPVAVEVAGKAGLGFPAGGSDVWAHNVTAPGSGSGREVATPTRAAMHVDFRYRTSGIDKACM